jgi:hypothetical protein
MIDRRPQVSEDYCQVANVRRSFKSGHPARSGPPNVALCIDQQETIEPLSYIMHSRIPKNRMHAPLSNAIEISSQLQLGITKISQCHISLW